MYIHNNISMYVYIYTHMWMSMCICVTHRFTCLYILCQYNVEVVPWMVGGAGWVGEGVNKKKSHVSLQ